MRALVRSGDDVACGVDTLYVTPQIFLGLESFIALRTSVWSFPRVRSHVNFKYANANKTSPTNLEYGSNFLSKR